MARRSIRSGGTVRRWRAGLADTLQLPSELVLDLPRLIWIGGESLTLENHRGIVEYTPQRVRVRVTVGYVVVEGRYLEIEGMTAADLSLRGDVRSVHLHMHSEGIHE